MQDKISDQGGIYIEDGVLIGHNAALATINHMKILRKEQEDISSRFTSKK